MMHPGALTRFFPSLCRTRAPATFTACPRPSRHLERLLPHRHCLAPFASIHTHLAAMSTNAPSSSLAGHPVDPTGDTERAPETWEHNVPSTPATRIGAVPIVNDLQTLYDRNRYLVLLSLRLLVALFSSITPFLLVGQSPC